ncbi:uncharacterized protein [Diadema setosum]|uniref:uncharacterized protein n=1 Tax=Diadema setosum TaxID=31175 RepID=UPI003B3B8B40
MFGPRLSQLNVSVCGHTLLHISNVGEGWIRSSDVTICCYGHEWPYPEIVFTASWTSEKGRIAIDRIEVNVPTETATDPLYEETYCKKLTTQSPLWTSIEPASSTTLRTTPIITTSERKSSRPTSITTTTEKGSSTPGESETDSDRPFFFPEFDLRDNLHLVIPIGIAVVSGIACVVMVFYCLVKRSREQKKQKKKKCAASVERPEKLEQSPSQPFPDVPPPLPPKKFRKEKVAPSKGAGQDGTTIIINL